jgi:hypothetical protein
MACYESNTDPEDRLTLRCRKIQGSGASDCGAGFEAFQKFFNLKAGKRSDVACQDEQMMLIAHIQGVDTAEYWVPSLIWLEKAHRLRDICSGELYLSVIDGSFKSFRSAPFREGEHDFLWRRSAVLSHAIQSDIQCGGEIMNGIANNQGQLWGMGLLVLGRNSTQPARRLE